MNYYIGMNLPEDGQYKVKSIEFVKLNVYSVTFTNDVSALYFTKQDQTVLHFLDKDVNVSFRQELFEENYCIVIHSFTIISFVNTLKVDSEVKLYINDLPKTNSNISFKDIDIGSTVSNAIVYCTKSMYESSKKAQWMILYIMDRDRKISTLRIFSPMYKDCELTGSYIKVNLSKTIYGFQSDIAEPLTDILVAMNPEVDIAENYVNNIISTLPDKYKELINQLKAILSMKHTIPINNYEVGFEVVRMAMCLSIAETFKNITPDINMPALQASIILQNIYLNDSDSYSPYVLMAGHLHNYPEILSVIENNPKLLESSILNNVNQIIANILEVRYMHTSNIKGVK